MRSRCCAAYRCGPEGCKTRVGSIQGAVKNTRGRGASRREDEDIPKEGRSTLSADIHD